MVTMAKQHQLWLAFRFSKQIADANKIIVKGLMRSKKISTSTEPKLLSVILTALGAPKDIACECMPEFHL
jgi:hypothetical protein